MELPKIYTKTVVRTGRDWAFLCERCVRDERQNNPNSSKSTEALLRELAVQHEVHPNSSTDAAAIGQDVLTFPDRFRDIGKQVILPALNQEKGQNPLVELVSDLDGLTTLAPSRDWSPNARIGLRLKFGPALFFVAVYPGVVMTLQGAGGTPHRDLPFEAITAELVGQEARALLAR